MSRAGSSVNNCDHDVEETNEMRRARKRIARGLKGEMGKKGIKEKMERSGSNNAAPGQIVLLGGELLTTIDAETDRGRRQQDQQGDGDKETGERSHHGAPFLVRLGNTAQSPGAASQAAHAWEAIRVVIADPGTASHFNFRPGKVSRGKDHRRGLVRAASARVARASAAAARCHS
jgi:hypothetical protein